MTMFGEHVSNCAGVQGPGHLHGHLRVLPRHPGVGHRAAAGQAQGQQTQEAGTAAKGEAGTLAEHFNFILSTVQDSPGEDESLELVPNITLNPSFNIDMLEHIEPEFHESR